MFVIASNITSREWRVAEALRQGLAPPLQELARRCLVAGADALEL